jgi:hypothetical protein
MSPTQSQEAALHTAGYTAMGHASPTLMCLTTPLEMIGAPDWDSLVYYAINYQLCDCGWH